MTFESLKWVELGKRICLTLLLSTVHAVLVVLTGWDGDLIQQTFIEHLLLPGNALGTGKTK